jgi:hypothetical protein
MPSLPRIRMGSCGFGSADGASPVSMPSARRRATMAGRRCGLLVLHGLEEVPDLRARLAGHDVVEPGRIGVRVGRGDDLDLVAVAQLGAQRHQLVVDAAATQRLPMSVCTA